MTETATADSQPAAVPDANQAADSAPAVADPNAADPSLTANGERLDRQTRNWRALERDRDHWREMAIRQTPQPPRQEPPPQADDKATPKTLADFEFDDAKYQAHLRAEIRREATDATRKELREQDERESAQRRQQSFSKREAAFAKSTPDYHEKTRDPDLKISNPMLEAAAESDDGPALLYYLASNPEIAEKIYELSPLGAARELGRIEAKLASEREKDQPEPSVAPRRPLRRSKARAIRRSKKTRRK